MQLIATVQATRRGCGLISGPHVECVSYFLNHRTMVNTHRFVAAHESSLERSIGMRMISGSRLDRSRVHRLFRERICRADECAVVMSRGRTVIS